MKSCVFFLVPCSHSLISPLSLLAGCGSRKMENKKRKTFIFMIIFLCRFDLWFLPFFQQRVLNEWRREWNARTFTSALGCRRGGMRAEQFNTMFVVAVYDHNDYSNYYHTYISSFVMHSCSLKANTKPPHLVKLKGESCNKK